MTRLIKALPMVAVALFMCISAHNASAQQDAKHRSYLYCSVEFGGDKIAVEETIGNYTRESKEWRVTLNVDYGQVGGCYTLKDSEGNKRVFNSQIAALNWLGMHGWELILTDDFMRNGTSAGGKLYLRLDVTGLSYDEINEQLSVFSNMKYDLDGKEDVKPQKKDGRF